MYKQEFISTLEEQLTQLSQIEKEYILNYYNETIEDRKEDGMSEEEAIGSLEPIENIVTQVLSEREFSVDEQQKKKDNRILKIILLVILFPFWFTVLVTAMMLYITLWMFIVTIGCFLVSFLLFIAVGLWNLIPIWIANTAAGVVLLGSLLLFGGCVPYTLKALRHSSMWLLQQTKIWLSWLKNSFQKVVY